MGLIRKCPLVLAICITMILLSGCGTDKKSEFRIIGEERNNISIASRNGVAICQLSLYSNVKLGKACKATPVFSGGEVSVKDTIIKCSEKALDGTDYYYLNATFELEDIAFQSESIKLEEIRFEDQENETKIRPSKVKIIKCDDADSVTEYPFYLNEATLVCAFGDDYLYYGLSKSEETGEKEVSIRNISFTNSAFQINGVKTPTVGELTEQFSMFKLKGFPSVSEIKVDISKMADEQNKYVIMESSVIVEYEYNGEIAHVVLPGTITYNGINFDDYGYLRQVKAIK